MGTGRPCATDASSTPSTRDHAARGGCRGADCLTGHTPAQGVHVTRRKNVLYFSYPFAGFSIILQQASANTMYLAESSRRVTQTPSALTRDDGNTSILMRMCSRSAIRGHHTERDCREYQDTRHHRRSLQSGGKAELVNGEIVHMSPTGRRPGRVGLRIAASLLHHEERVGGGIAFPDNVGFIVNTPRILQSRCGMVYRPGYRHALLPRRARLRCRGTQSVRLRPGSRTGDAGQAHRLLRLRHPRGVGRGFITEDVIKSYKASDPAHPVIFRSRKIMQTRSQRYRGGRWRSMIFLSNAEW